MTEEIEVYGCGIDCTCCCCIGDCFALEGWGEDDDGGVQTSEE